MWVDYVDQIAPLPQALQVTRTLVMGVLNVTPDSFSDGGQWLEADAAIAHGLQMAAQGADIVDVGGESTRPGAARVSLDDEAQRVVPVVRALSQAGIVVSIDTIHAATAAACLEAGALIVNDVSGTLADPAMPGLVAERGCLYICQHWRGDPTTMDTLTDYGGDVVAGVMKELGQRLDVLAHAGVNLAQVIIDPGLGFAKTHPQSWQLLAATGRLGQELGRPVLVGASRKRFLAAALTTTDSSGAGPSARDAATCATTALAALAGAWAVRVHDVASSADAVRTASLWKDNR